MRLTDEAIRKQKRPTTGQLLVWDELVSGFGVRFTPTRKDSAAFVVQWRQADGKKPRESLRPNWPAMSVAQARDKARKRLSEVVALSTDAAGSEPLRVAIRRYYEKQSEAGAWRPRYRSKVDSIIRSYVEGEPSERIKLTPTAKAAIVDIGSKAVSTVSRSDILRVADHIKSGSAEQFMAIISSFYNWAFERGVEVTNPARNRLRVTGGRNIRTRILSDADFLTLWRAVEGEGDPALAAFALLAYTGARRREVTQMRWTEVDFETATWTLPPERRKTGRKDREPFVINLHPAAVEIIRRQPELEGSPFVLWGRRDRKPYEFGSGLMTRLRKLGVEDWRIHDLRRYMRSGLARIGVTQTVAEMCLGHIAKNGLVGVYDRYAYSDEKRAAWIQWGDQLSALTAAAPTEAK